MTGEAVEIGEAEEVVEQSGVAKVDLGRFDLALAYILVPRLQLSDHVGSGEDVQIRSNGFIGETHRACEF